jgi:hypothetical protein
MPPGRRKITDKEEQQPLFLDSINLMELPVNSSLPEVEILKTSYKKLVKNLELKVRIPDTHRLVNIYLRVNGEKKDMFYQVQPGSYTFSLSLPAGNNTLELFYTSNSSKSNTTKINIEAGER